MPPDKWIQTSHQEPVYLEIVYLSSTLCLKKVPTFKLSVTLSYLNQFLIFFLHCWKAYEICYKTHMTLPTSP